MSEWFQERYISRHEHEAVVEYYRSLVAQLHCKVCELRNQVDAQALENLVTHNRRMAERELDRRMNASLVEHGGNVIKLDFSRRRG